MRKELWKDVDGYEELYEVSNLGRLRRSIKDTPHDGTYPGRLLSGTIVRGYRKVVLHKLGCPRKMFFIHRLVAQAFIPNPKDKQQINHKNGVKDDNKTNNLEWCTSKENVTHSIKMGLRDNRGVRAPKAKLNKRKVLRIRSLYRKGLYQYRIAEMFGVTQGAIACITRRATWKHF